MQTLAFIALPFLLCFYLGRRSLALGMAGALAAGYAYGIVRANYLGASFFLFDSACAGLYLAAWMRKYDMAQRLRVMGLLRWILALTIWPVILFFLPIQDYMVQLVGLRGFVFFLPMMLIAAALTDEEIYTLALSLAILNLVAFGFAVAEYFRGIAPYYPHNAVTYILYSEGDVLGIPTRGRQNFYRIPATFPVAAAYGAAMNITLPLLVGAWQRTVRMSWRGGLLLAAIGASVLGVFMCACRQQAVGLFVLAGAFTLSGGVSRRNWLMWVALAAGVAWLVVTTNRLQRFTQLQDTTMVGERVYVSVNSSFLELAERYPLGNGLGGGGTSIPYFLQNRIHHTVGLENEYSRIMLELGIPGLLLWVGFMLWVLTRKGAWKSDSWALTRRMGWFVCLESFLSAAIGVGMMTAIPDTAMLFLYVGWVAAPPQPSTAEVRTPATEDEAAAQWHVPRRRYGW